MANSIKMVVFDMAGTTIDENNVVYKTVRKAINQFGFEVTLDQVLEQGAGKEKRQAIKSVLNTYTDTTDAALTDKIYQVFVGELAQAYRTLDIRPQPNALEVLSALQKRNIITVLNTGYNRETAEAILAKLGWEEGREFDALVTATDVDKNRPNPAMILYAMDDFSMENGENVMKVGDSIIDIEEGRNAGCLACVGITTGAHTREQLETASPDYIIDSLIELIPIIDAIQLGK